MDKYLNASDVKENGERLSLPYGPALPLIKNGEKLVVVLNNGVRDVAVNVTDNYQEYKHFYDAYSTGAWLTFSLYKLDNLSSENGGDND